jgi:hypothetical protein
MKYAPLAIFVYNRPNKLKHTLVNLKKNFLLEKTKVYIFSDGPKNKLDLIKIKKVRKIIESSKIKIEKKFYFTKNKGLKKNILEGVNYIFKIHKKIIVLEDDIITSRYFLNFMNNSLNFIERQDDIWHISAWNQPIKIKKIDRNKIIFNNQMYCWGWATHKKFWKNLILDAKYLITNIKQNEIEDFTLNNGLSTWSQLNRNNEKKLKSWAIFWYSTIFVKKKLCISPLVSYSKNIGFNQSSTNSKKIIKQNSKLNNMKIANYKLDQNVNEFYQKKILLFLKQKSKKNFIHKLFNKFNNAMNK